MIGLCLVESIEDIVNFRGKLDPRERVLVLQRMEGFGAAQFWCNLFLHIILLAPLLAHEKAGIPWRRGSEESYNMMGWKKVGSQ